jgi:hypothetical protein
VAETGVNRGGIAAGGTLDVGIASLVTFAADFAAGLGSNLATGLGIALVIGLVTGFGAGLASVGLLGRRAGLVAGFDLPVGTRDNALTSSSLFMASQSRTPRRRAISVSSFFVRSVNGPAVLIVGPLPHAFGRLWDGHTGIRAGFETAPGIQPGEIFAI